MVSRDVAIKVPRGKIIIFHFVLAMMDIMTMKLLWESHYCRDDKIIFYLKQTFKNIAKPDKINPQGNYSGKLDCQLHSFFVETVCKQFDCMLCKDKY